MSIKEKVKKIKGLFTLSGEKDLLIVSIIILSSLASFGLGRLSKIEENRLPIMIESASSTLQAAVYTVAAADASSKAGGGYVASKNGSKYYFPWCGGAQKISEKNKITFASKEEAEKAGYQPAANCKGL